MKSTSLTILSSIMDFDSEDSAPQFYCSKVHTSDGATWFAGVELTAKLDHPRELMDATFNLTITDGQTAWVGKGTGSNRFPKVDRCDNEINSQEQI